MEAEGIDLILASSRRNIAYLTDHQTEHWTWEHAILHMMEKEFDGGDYVLFAGFPLNADRGTFLVDYAHREEAIRKQGAFVDDFYGYWKRGRIPAISGSGISLEQDYSRTAEEAVVRAILDRRLEYGTIGVEMPRISSSVLERLRSLLPHARFVDTFDLLFDIRQIKTAEEIRRLREAYRIAAEVYSDLFQMLRSGMTPLEALRYEMDGIYRRGGSFSFAHLFFGSGEQDIAFTPPSDRPLKPGDTGTLDLGVVYEGYSTDFARMAQVLPARTDLAKVFRVVLDARRAVEDALKPGAKARDVFLAGARCLEEGGLCSSISNNGHGIGLGCHEKPFLTPYSEDSIAVGQTVVIEIYSEVQGVGPVLLEDGGEVTPEGWQSFTNLPLDIVEIS